MLLANGVDALLKLAVQKAITLFTALLLSAILRCIVDIYPSFAAIEEVNDVRTMAGIISGWLGQCATETIPYKIEVMMDEWLSREYARGNNLVEAPINITRSTKDDLPTPHDVINLTSLPPRHRINAQMYKSQLVAVIS